MKVAGASGHGVALGLVGLLTITALGVKTITLAFGLGDVPGLASRFAAAFGVAGKAAIGVGVAATAAASKPIIHQPRTLCSRREGRTEICEGALDRLPPAKLHSIQISPWRAWAPRNHFALAEPDP